MDMFEFYADRQFIFHIEIGGCTYSVAFSDRNQFGNSVYVTGNAMVAEKIRQTSMFKRGAIRESEAGRVKGEGSPGNGVGAGAKAPEVKRGEMKSFANFTQAREWLCKEYGLKKSDIRNPGMVAKAAKEHGVEVQYEH